MGQDSEEILENRIQAAANYEHNRVEMVGGLITCSLSIVFAVGAILNLLFGATYLVSIGLLWIAVISSWLMKRFWINPATNS